MRRARPLRYITAIPAWALRVPKLLLPKVAPGDVAISTVLIHSDFLQLLDYNVGVKAAVYTDWYFRLGTMCERNSMRLRPLDGQEVRAPNVRPHFRRRFDDSQFERMRLCRRRERLKSRRPYISPGSTETPPARSQALCRSIVLTPRVTQMAAAAAASQRSDHERS